jgi:hypothetical protein
MADLRTGRDNGVSAPVHPGEIDGIAAFDGPSTARDPGWTGH